MMPWKTFVARSALAATMVGVAVFASMRLAMAVPGGPTRNAFTFAGVLRNPDGGPGGATTLTFTFHRGGLDCTPAGVAVTPNGNGAFSVQVPIDACPSTFFDGSDVTYDIAQAGETMPIAMGVAITPVPYARFADQVGVNNDCPAGYTRDTGDAGASPPIIVCYNTNALGRDEVVKVGNGASAFWVDRYEASVVDRTGMRRDTVTGVLSENGQWTGGLRESLFAVSQVSVQPISAITWFQARSLCRASGKRLMTRDEWFSAADGLTAIEATLSNCNRNGTTVRQTGMGSSCRSSWGAQDLVGNLWEWTDEWDASVGATTALAPDGGAAPPVVASRRVNNEQAVWPVGYGGDGTWNISSAVENTTSDRFGIPSAVVRGGAWNSGSLAGVYALDMDYGPSTAYDLIGFRCVIPR